MCGLTDPQKKKLCKGEHRKEKERFSCVCGVQTLTLLTFTTVMTDLNHHPPDNSKTQLWRIHASTLQSCKVYKYVPHIMMYGAKPRNSPNLGSLLIQPLKGTFQEPMLPPWKAEIHIKRLLCQTMYWCWTPITTNHTSHSWRKKAIGVQYRKDRLFYAMFMLVQRNASKIRSRHSIDVWSRTSKLIDARLMADPTTKIQSAVDMLLPCKADHRPEQPERYYARSCVGPRTLPSLRQKGPWFQYQKDSPMPMHVLRQKR